MNIKNIKQLLKAYFIENWKTDLFQFGILAAIVLFGTIMNGRGGNLNFPIFVSLVFLMIYPERLFRNLHSNSPKIHYLSIPASNSEKVVTNMLLANIYYIVGLVISCALGLVLAQLYLKVRGYDGVNLYLNNYMFDGNGAGILMVFASLAMFFFGSIYFRRRTTLSTIGVSMLIGMVFSLLVALTLWVNGMMLIPKDASYRDFVWSFDSSISISDTMENVIGYVGLSASIIYFYVLSFLRLKETEA
jgi:hypothetical protein